MDLQFHSPSLTLGHVNSCWEKGKFKFTFHGTVITEGFMSQQTKCRLLSPSRNPTHDTDLLVFTKAALRLHSCLLY
jgi:hypothetical protein